MKTLTRLAAFALAFTLLGSACSSAGEDSAAGVEEQDPVAAFEAQVDATVAAAVASGKTDVGFMEASAKAQSWFDGGYAYDVKETDSLVRPYEGELVLTLRWANNGEENPNFEETVIAYYQYSDGVWTLVDAERCVNYSGEGWKCGTDEHDSYWLALVESF